MPQISIITPVYINLSQQVDWLDEMIMSVQAQNFTDWELVLVNDRSPVPFDAIIMKHQTDSRLRWFDNAQNFGPAMTRNTAVTLAQSECILPLDSDDLLAENNTLESLYNYWSLDQTKIIYGNLCQYTAIAGTGRFERGKVIELGNYTFELAMNLSGIMPVTAMHSKACHLAAGGWKSELALGMEDVEYWIAAGERGYCGQKINHTTLVYRRYEQSRSWQLKFVHQKFETMQQEIKKMHNDIYQGRLPEMACGCNDNATHVLGPIVMTTQPGEQRVVELQGYNEADLEWVLYNGGKKARFDILAQGPANLPPSYTIFGTGQVFQIHKRHRNIFAQRQRLGFQMNQPDPRAREEVLEPQTAQAERAILPEPQTPEMATIVRMDAVAAQSLKADIQPIPEHFLPEIEPETAKEYTLSDLELGAKVEGVLAADTVRLWTVEKLARAIPETLTAYKGIGGVKARAIISKAQSLIKNT